MWMGGWTWTGRAMVPWMRDLLEVRPGWVQVLQDKDQVKVPLNSKERWRSSSVQRRGNKGGTIEMSKKPRSRGPNSTATPRGAPLRASGSCRGSTLQPSIHTYRPYIQGARFCCTLKASLHTLFLVSSARDGLPLVSERRAVAGTAMSCSRWLGWLQNTADRSQASPRTC